MEKVAIIKNVVNGLRESRFMLFALLKYEQNYDRSPSKLELMKFTNQFYEKAVEQNLVEPLKNGGPLIRSRHMLDVYAARLEGGGVVTIEEVGRIRIYRLSEQGKEVMRYIKEYEGGI